MLNYLPLAALFICMQLSGAYLRYLPFAAETTEGRRRLFCRCTILWSFLSFVATILVLWQTRLHPGGYKLLVAALPLPYFFIAWRVLGGPFWAHLFILGMQYLWALALHTVVAIGEGLWLKDMTDGKILFCHPLFYLVLFLLTFPFAGRMFRQLLPSIRPFANRKIGLTLSLLPLSIFIGLMLPIADAAVLHSLKVQLSRISIPLFLIIMYRSVSRGALEADARREEEHRQKLLEAQAAFLREQERLLRQSQREADRLADTVRNDYRRLDGYLAAGDMRAALQFIESKEGELKNSRPLPAFTTHSIVNAALTVYSERAKASGLSLRCRINLPPRLEVDEHEFATLLANLLENAIQAAAPVAKKREITLSIRYRGSTMALELVNPTSSPLLLDAKGLPVAAKRNHGLGMASLSAFMKKYDAYADFTQEGDTVRFLLYCNGE